MLSTKMAQSGFQGIPVLIEGVEVTALDARWESTGLRSRDAITGTDARTIATDVAEALRPTRDRLRAEPVAEALAQKLLSLVGSEPALQNVAAPLGEGMVPEPVARHLALRLLQASSSQVVEVAKRLAVAYEQAAKATLYLALPFSLFDRAGPRALDVAIRHGQPAALNPTEARFTIGCYLLIGASEYPRGIAKSSRCQMVRTSMRRLARPKARATGKTARWKARQIAGRVRRSCLPSTAAG